MKIFAPASFLLFICGLLLPAFLAQGQSKKALKRFQQAKAYATENDYDRALERLEDALASSPDFTQARLMAADIYRRREQLEQSLAQYEALRQYEPPYYLDLFQGRLLFEMQRYPEARQFLEAYRQNPKATERYRLEAEKLLASCDFAEKALAEQQVYQPYNLGPAINSEDMEYFPSISADGLRLVFTHRKLSGERQDEDFWYSERDSASGEWAPARPLPGRLNTPGNEGAQTQSADGGLIFFAACERPDGYGSCDIYASFRDEQGQWGKAINLGRNVNSSRWESQPSLSADGQSLYFVRGGSSQDPNIDIYVSRLGPEGWGPAEALPGAVNTEGQDVSPFIHFDNQHLYFSSNGHPGFGDLDFFVSERQPDGTWGEPQNLGSPINTPAQEFSLIVGPDGRTGYFSSDALEEGMGELDLYRFELPPAHRAQAIAYLRGRVIDRESRAAVFTPLMFEDLADSSFTWRNGSNREGRFYAVLPGQREYALNIQAPGYLFYSANFALEQQGQEEALELLVELEPIAVGQAVRLENVFFDYDSYDLQPRSRAELRQVQRFLERNPGLEVELAGHTDNQGTAAYNTQLSKDRARVVYEHLVAAGIAPERLSYRGYGATEPLADNSTEEGRARNRRTEMRIKALKP